MSSCLPRPEGRHDFKPCQWILSIDRRGRRGRRGLGGWIAWRWGRDLWLTFGGSGCLLADWVGGRGAGGACAAGFAEGCEDGCAAEKGIGPGGTGLIAAWLRRGRSGRLIDFGFGGALAPAEADGRDGTDGDGQLTVVETVDLYGADDGFGFDDGGKNGAHILLLLIALNEGLDTEGLDFAVVEQLHDDLLEGADFEIEPVEDESRLGKDGRVGGDFGEGGAELVLAFNEEVRDVDLNAGFEALKLTRGGGRRLPQLGDALGQLRSGGGEFGGSFVEGLDAAGDSFHGEQGSVGGFGILFGWIAALQEGLAEAFDGFADGGEIDLE